MYESIPSVIILRQHDGLSAAKPSQFFNTNPTFLEILLKCVVESCTTAFWSSAHNNAFAHCTACSKVLTAPSGRIVSPRWPGNYPMNANCEVRIITPPGNKISFFFTLFSIESHSRCNFDYLAVSRDVEWNFQVWKFHKFREFFEIIQDPLFEIFIEIMYFNYNSPITRKKCQSSLTIAKGQCPEEQRNDTYL